MKSLHTTDELIEIHQGGWKIDIETHFLFKFYVLCIKKDTYNEVIQ